MTTPENLPKVVSREQWLAARKELLVKEKEVTRLAAAVNAERRRLPMVRIDKPYTFDGPNGRVSLLDLFEGRPQLVMHHFMWTYDIDADGTEHPRDTGCSSCSSAADQIPARLSQLHARNTSLVAVSRAPYEKIAAFRSRMGWTFPWYSSAGGDFNYDFHATVDDRVAPVQIYLRGEAELAAAGMPFDRTMRGDWPGISAFLRVGDEVFHTYSTFGRGIEQFHNGYPYLDLTALGRQEHWEEPKGRAVPLGRQVGGPGMRLPDEYDV
ncbi:protein of unknown function DUF899 thioredoxin family protein [Kribbella flavida DSM 17836]|uniref:DUF899 domain-containing protein n=1 Tax=Kribbella flavida (strain DSM 17836 / JCM 10339 / NBRC 14399) TaxID=479435 RepID=D2PPZ7_KRIFD|nr:DUF899 domain-containing protein [Kribbella flavida]ADB32921.1 protein of unknown function DUF899 thioredoxin family protein [Kribbella flavida DSM 17836]